MKSWSLGPIFFGIFVNDLPLHVKDVQVACDMLAYGTTVHTSRKCIMHVEHALQGGLDQVTSFYDNNSTVINPRKTHSMTIVTRQKHKMLPFSLELLLTWKVEQVAQHLPSGITDFRWTHILTQCAKHFPSVSFFY